MSTDSSKPAKVHKATKQPEVPKITKTWSVWLGVLVGLVALFGSQIIAGIILSIYPILRHWSAAHGSSWLSNSIIAQFIYVAIAESIAIALVYWFLKKNRSSFKAIGLRKPKWMDPVFGLMGLPAYFVIYIVLLNVVTHFAPHLNVSEKQQLGFNNVAGLPDILLTFVSLVVLPPIAEEIIFRGLIYTSLRRKMRMWGAAVVTSLLFAAGHLPEGGSSGPLYIAAIDTFSLSLVLVYLREKTGGLYASMTLHGLKNLIAFIALLATKQL
jgi:membrane protease YdiL (CAAX protease family)